MCERVGDFQEGRVNSRNILRDRCERDKKREIEVMCIGKKALCTEVEYVYL